MLPAIWRNVQQGEPQPIELLYVPFGARIIFHLRPAELWQDTDQFNALDPALVRVPTLLLQGEHDPLAKTEAHARLFSRLGHADRQWVIIPGGTHAAILEDTLPRVVEALVGFMERGE